MEHARIILAGGETHRVNSIQVLLSGTGHEIVEVARTRSSAIHALGNIGTSGANLLLLDTELEPEVGRETDPDADARAILAAMRPEQQTSGGSAEDDIGVVAISYYPMPEYGVREGVTLDIGHGGVPDLPEVIDRL